MSRPPGHPTETEPLELVEYHLIMAQLPMHWQLFFRLMWATGLRVSEILAIRRTDIDATGVWVRRKKRKDKRRDHIPLDEHLLRELSEPSHKRTSVLFPVSAQGVFYALKLAVRKAGVRSTIHPHSFRHGFGRRAVQANLAPGKSALENLALVQQMMGHVSIRSTEVYIKPSKGDVADSWRHLNP